MGAHAIPVEYLNDKETYLKFLVEELKNSKKKIYLNELMFL